MFGIWKVTSFALGGGLMPYAQVADAVATAGGTDPAGAGDGSTPSEASAGGEVVEDGTAAGADASGSDADDDWLPSDEDIDAARPLEDRFKAVLGKYRKLQRRAAKNAARDQRLKGVDVEELFTAQRQLKSLTDAIGRLSPKKRALLYGPEDDAPVASAPAPPPAAAVPDFDEAGLPFDPNENPVNRYFADLAKANHELRRQVLDLKGGFDREQQNIAASKQRAEAQTWKAATDAAAATMHPWARKSFMDNMAAAFMTRDKHGRTPQWMVDHYTKDMPAELRQAAKEAAAAASPAPTGKPAGRPTAATQQRIAEQNKTLPKTVAPSGVPAPAKSERPSIADLGKRLRRGL